MWSALANPYAFQPLIPRPPEDPGDISEQAAWWTPLVHLARFGLGLPHPGAGLHAFLRGEGDGSPGTEAARCLIDLWWGQHIEDFLAWGTGGGDAQVQQGFDWPLDWPAEHRRLQDERLERLRHSPRWRATWAGGGDPLHLSHHSDYPLSRNAFVELLAREGRLVLRSRGYGGWYRALMHLTELVPKVGGEATVEIEGFGELGTFRLRHGELPRLQSLPRIPPPRRRADRDAPSAGQGQSPPSPQDGLSLLRTVLCGAVEEIRRQPGSRFVLDVPSAHGGDGAYTQALSLADGRVYAEVPSDQFLAPALAPSQKVHLLKLGWSDPDGDTPNHWREWPSEVAPTSIAELLLTTLTTVYDVTGGKFSLAPASLAAKVIPDSVPVTFTSGEGDSAAEHANYRSWLALIERASVPSPTAVALSVARCLEVDAARAQPGHPCRPIVTLQPPSAHRFQVPEAWAGNIRDGRIVFISSNPSISDVGDHQSGSVAEQYPTADWSDDDIADFVLHRFDSQHGWATPEGRFLRQDGTLSPKPVAFWNNVRRRAEELLEHQASPSTDYAMTEVVHCKSKGELGVASAAATCADRHLDSVLQMSPADLVVVLGQRSRILLSDRWPLPAGFGTQKGAGWQEKDNLVVVTVGGKERLVAYLWHPTGATAPKTFAGAYPLHLERLRALVRGDIPPGAVVEPRA